MDRGAAKKRRDPNKFLATIVRKPFQCRDCGSAHGYRSRPRNVIEKYILPVLGLRRVRCADCFRDTYMLSLTSRFWFEDDGQDIAEYAVMLAVILVIVVGTLRLIGSNANNAFSSVASSLQ